MSETLNKSSIAQRFLQSSTFGMERVPKYLRLSNAMLDAIESGEFRPGSRMPGERYLMDTLPVSLGTIQKAMNALVDQGVVIRRPGMGTFVSGASSQANHTDEEPGKPLKAISHIQDAFDPYERLSGIQEFRPRRFEALRHSVNFRNRLDMQIYGQERLAAF